MLFANLEFETLPGTRERFIETATKVMAQSRQDPGCSFTADLEREDRFHITELWRSSEAIAEHLARPHAVAASAVISAITKVISAHVYEGDVSALPVNIPGVATAS
jgi:quinol monooxygenase YgiN